MPSNTRKDPSFKKYAETLYSNSLVTGVPEIIQAGDWRLRFMRLVVLLSCLIGFVYQTHDFMKLYWKYPTTLDIQISRLEEIMMPAFTVCDPNGIVLSKYCKNYPCKKPTEERRFCRCYPEGRYCERKRLYPFVKIPMAVGSISALSYVPQEERLHLMPTAETFVSSCVLKQPPFTETMSCGKSILNPSCSNIVKQPSSCYTFNNLYKKPKATSRNISTSAVIEMALFTPPHEYDPDMKMMYKTISIHSPYSLSNPFIEGIFLHSEHSYKIFVKQTIKKLMKPPYDTNCFDYIEEWIKNDGTGPISESDCIQFCKMKHNSLDRRGCQPFSIWYPHNEARCNNSKRDACKIVDDLFLVCNETLQKMSDEHSQKIAETCAAECKPACWQISYEVTKEEAKQIQFKKKKGVAPKKETLCWRYSGCPMYRNKKRGLTFVTISFQKMEQTVYSYTPKYNIVEIFSYMGGYIGIWLGISLVALFEFLETTIALLKYPFRKKPRRLNPKRA